MRMYEMIKRYFIELGLFVFRRSNPINGLSMSNYTMTLLPKYFKTFQLSFHAIKRNEAE